MGAVEADHPNAAAAAADHMAAAAAAGDQTIAAPLTHRQLRKDRAAAMADRSDIHHRRR